LFYSLGRSLMRFLPFILFLLPFIVEGSQLCDKDACLMYNSTCDGGRGVWIERTKNESMEDWRCDMMDYIRHELFLSIDMESPYQWNLVVSSPDILSFIIKSHQFELRMKNEYWWIYKTNEEIRETPHRRNALTQEFELVINETTTLLEVLADAKISITIKDNNMSITYESPQLWRLAEEREGPVSCEKRDIKPSFLIVLIAYAVFATIVAFLLILMIFCIGRDSKYKRVPTNNESTKKESRKEITKEAQLPELDPTTAGTKIKARIGNGYFSSED
ncbi:hypothetical protein PENTCL1PPCAC_6999, partial [Pristionchus entomophagus]